MKLSQHIVDKHHGIEEFVNNLLDRLGDLLGGRSLSSVHSTIDLNTRMRGEAVI